MNNSKFSCQPAGTKCQMPIMSRFI